MSKYTTNVGFDIVIANPPYVNIANIDEVYIELFSSKL
jgi:methylase of polypeptide subunit release factors